MECHKGFDHSHFKSFDRWSIFSFGYPPEPPEVFHRSPRFKSSPSWKRLVWILGSWEVVDFLRVDFWYVTIPYNPCDWYIFTIIYLHLNHKSQPNVGIYTSPMDSVGRFVSPLLSWLGKSTNFQCDLRCGKSHTTHSMTAWFLVVIWRCFFHRFFVGGLDFNRKKSRESWPENYEAWRFLKIMASWVDLENLEDLQHRNWANGFSITGPEKFSLDIDDIRWPNFRKEKTVTQYVSRRNVTQLGVPRVFFLRGEPL